MTPYYDLPVVGAREFANDQFEAWFKRQIVERGKANQQIYAKLQAADQQLGELIAGTYGDKSAFYKYWRRQRVPTPPDLNRRARRVWREFRQWAAAERRRAKAQDYRQRRAQANVVLQEFGYVPGEHYAPTRAITFAKTVLNPEQPGVRMLPEGDVGTDQ